jgi:hypothetical protein
VKAGGCVRRPEEYRTYGTRLFHRQNPVKLLTQQHFPSIAGFGIWTDDKPFAILFAAG